MTSPSAAVPSPRMEAASILSGLFSSPAPAPAPGPVPFKRRGKAAAGKMPEASQSRAAKAKPYKMPVRLPREGLRPVTELTDGAPSTPRRRKGPRPDRPCPRK